ncbi:MAG: hypothetical protein AAF483_00845 [Planctomycetota bacterium]
MIRILSLAAGILMVQAAWGQSPTNGSQLFEAKLLFRVRADGSLDISKPGINNWRLPACLLATSGVKDKTEAFPDVSKKNQGEIDRILIEVREQFALPNQISNPELPGILAKANNDIGKLLGAENAIKVQAWESSARFYKLGPREYLKSNEIDDATIQECQTSMQSVAFSLTNSMRELELKALDGLLGAVPELANARASLLELVDLETRLPTPTTLVLGLRRFEGLKYARVERIRFLDKYTLGIDGGLKAESQSRRDLFRETMAAFRSANLLEDPFVREVGQELATGYIQLQSKRAQELNARRSRDPGESREKYELEVLEPIEQKYDKLFLVARKEAMGTLTESQRKAHRYCEYIILLVRCPDKTIFSSDTEQSLGVTLRERHLKPIARAAQEIEAEILKQARELQTRAIEKAFLEPLGRERFQSAFGWLEFESYNMPPLELLLHHFKKQKMPR